MPMTAEQAEKMAKGLLKSDSEMGKALRKLAKTGQTISVMAAEKDEEDYEYSLEGFKPKGSEW